jgi:hypothetical protein
MGADLYIENMDREKQITGFEVSDRAVNLGYFRDCYNNGGLFSVMSQTLNKTVSWGQMSREVGLNKKRVLPLTKLKKWKEKMSPLLEEFKKQDTLYCEDWSPKNIAAHKKVKMDSKQIKEYRDWADKLMRFIDLAIEKKSGIIWSV